MQTQIQKMIIKLEHLAPNRLAEVDDFIDFLHQRDSFKVNTQLLAQASNPAFAKIWDNDEDAIYDQL